jgi:hypothetical protein
MGVMSTLGRNSRLPRLLTGLGQPIDGGNTRLRVGLAMLNWISEIGGEGK